MNSPFLKDFNTILNDILTDYKNQQFLADDGSYIQVDTSQGSLVFIKSGCFSSALWGLYKYVAWTGDQVFVDTCDSPQQDHWGYIFNVPRKYAEADGDYVPRILNRIQQPPAGGNQNDFVQWALSITNVKSAWCFPLGNGVGTVDVVITADSAVTGSEIPSSYAALNGTATAIAQGNLEDAAANFQAGGVAIGDAVTNIVTGATATVTAVTSATELALSADIFQVVGQGYTLTSLCQQVLAYLVTMVPSGPDWTYALRVLPPTINTQNVDITVSGTDVDTTQIEADVTAYMQALIPAQTLVLAQLVSIAIKDGATDAVIPAPAANVVPVGYQMIRPGVINAAIA